MNQQIPHERRERSIRSVWSWWYRDNRELLRLGLLAVVVFAVLGILAPELFLSETNLRSMAFQLPEITLLSLAMLAAMLSGGIDLSVIGVMNLAAILGGLLLSSGADLPAPMLITLSILLVLVVGLGCGVINGLLVSRIGIVPILATLGTWQVYSGIGVIITGGAAVYGFPTTFSRIGNGTWLGVPIPLYVMLLLALLLGYVLNRTQYGHSLYMMGTNPLAARFAGLPNERLIVTTYAISGVLAASAGVIVMSRVNSIRVDFGSSYLLLAILIAVLGGVNPYGGFGKVAGVVLAVVTLQFVSSGLNLMRFSNFARELVWGGLLLAVMVLNSEPFETFLARLRKGGRGARARKSEGGAT